MANKKITIDNLSSEVQKILSDYTKDVEMITDKLSVKAANMCVKELKANSASNFKVKTGQYAKGWRKKQTHFSSGHVSFTIYNNVPGLTHLLEHGHQLRQGGRFSGKEHIAPAEKTASEFFENAVKEAIGNA